MTATGSPALSHRRARWVAFLLSLCLPGLGHLYAGLPKRALASYAAVMTSVALMITLLLWYPFGPLTFYLALFIGLAPYLTVAVQALRAAAMHGPHYKLEWYNRWYIYLGLIVVLGLAGDAAFGRIRSSAFRAYRIPSGAMEPTLLIGDCLYVSVLPDDDPPPTRGSIVVFDSRDEPGIHTVKRVIGLPGDTVSMRENVLYRNREAQVEPYIQLAPGDEDYRDPKMTAAQLPYLISGHPDPYDATTRNWGPLVVPRDSAFLLGDNRDNSYDSRFYGHIGFDRLIGRPHIIYYSYDPNGILPLPFITAVRWGRLGMRLRH